MGSDCSPGRTANPAFRCIAFGFLLLALLVPPSWSQQKNPAGPPPVAVMAQLSRVTVPDVRGRTPGDAQTLLQKVGLLVGRTAETAGPGAAGTVWRQSPAAGNVVVRGSSVNLDLVPQKSPTNPSHGDNEFKRLVPSLIGRSRVQALELLSRVNLKLGKVTEGEATGAEGTIFAQNPQAGLWVPVLSSVDVQVVQSKKQPSGGSEEFPSIIVPSVRGQTTKAATQILLQSGLRIGAVSSGNASAPVGTIYAQQPLANSRVRAETPVNVWVAEAKSTPTVSVPSVIHRDIQSAEGFLQHSRLRLGQVEHQVSDNFVGLITAQSPEPGTRVEVGTSVNVVVAQERPLIAVPDVVRRDEGSAASILSAAGLRMGMVSQKVSEESSGTILSQYPKAGTKVQTGTNVNVTVSHQLLRQLIVMADDPNPEIGKPVKFHAHLDPEGSQFKYLYTFGDGAASKWTSQSTVTHAYQAAGSYRVQAVAMRGTTRIPSESAVIVAKEIEFKVLLVPTPTRAKPLDEIAFTAKASRSDLPLSYQFDFADGTQSDWSPEPVTRHIYDRPGTYPAKVRARVAQGRIVESVVPVEVGIVPWTLWAALGTGLAGLGGGAFIFHGWRQFLKWIRVVPKMDPGGQHLRIESREGWGDNCRLRLVKPPGEQRIVWAGGPGRQEGPHS